MLLRKLGVALIMSYKVIVSYEASIDLNNIVNYVYYSLKNPSAANHLLDMFENVVNSLAEFPRRHPVNDDPVLHAYGIRVVVVGNYLALYTVDEELKKVSIVRFMYRRRDWISILSENSSFTKDSSTVHEKEII